MLCSICHNCPIVFTNAPFYSNHVYSCFTRDQLRLRVLTCVRLVFTWVYSCSASRIILVWILNNIIKRQKKIWKRLFYRLTFCCSIEMVNYNSGNVFINLFLIWQFLLKFYLNWRLNAAYNYQASTILLKARYMHVLKRIRIFYGRVHTWTFSNRTPNLTEKISLTLLVACDHFTCAIHRTCLIFLCKKHAYWYLIVVQ